MDEFQLIDRLVEVGWRGSRDVLVGPGDDGAVLRGGVVVSTDMMVEDIHYEASWISAAELGFRAAAAGLSDMAAMGARPMAVLMSLAVPAADDLAVGIQEGVAKAASRASASVVGGDVSRSPGPVVVDITTVGRTRRAVTRGGASPGQDIWLSGSVGGAAWAVQEWKAGREPPPEARRRFVEPPDRTQLGRRLADEEIATAMIDVSDGVVADLGHLVERSGVRGVLLIATVPRAPGLPQGLNLGLGGGEDYELLFAAEPDTQAAISRISVELDVPLTRVGTLERGDGVVIELPDGRRRVQDGMGFDHFATRRTSE